MDQLLSEPEIPIQYPPQQVSYQMKFLKGDFVRVSRHSKTLKLESCAGILAQSGTSPTSRFSSFVSRCRIRWRQCSIACHRCVRAGFFGLPGHQPRFDVLEVLIEVSNYQDIPRHFAKEISPLNPALALVGRSVKQGLSRILLWPFYQCFYESKGQAARQRLTLAGQPPGKGGAIAAHCLHLRSSAGDSC